MVDSKLNTSLFRIMSKVIFICFLFLSGCVSWRENRVQSVGNFPSNSLNATICVDLKASLKSNGINAVSQETFSKDNMNKFLNIAKNKGVFKNISSSNKNADYILRINYEVENNGFSGLSIATLFILPGTDRFEHTMNMELIRNKDSKIIDNYTVTEKGQNLYHILLLFAMPFAKSTREIYEASYNDISDNILERVYTDIKKN